MAHVCCGIQGIPLLALKPIANGGVLFSSAAMAAMDDGNHGNHLVVNEAESIFFHWEFLKCFNGTQSVN